MCSPINGIATSAASSYQRITRSVTRRLQIFSRLFVLSRNPPIITARPPGTGLKVHIGCGSVNLFGWINIDARPLPHVHIVSSDLMLSQFTDGSIDHLYLCHVLEHLSYSDIDLLLVQYLRKLSPAGVIMISVPDFSAIVDTYLSNNRDLNLVKYPLFGGQDYQYNYHKSAFDRKLLTSILLKSGFDNIHPWVTEDVFGSDIGDWSNICFDRSHGGLPISLNLCATKKCP